MALNILLQDLLILRYDIFTHPPNPLSVIQAYEEIIKNSHKLESFTSKTNHKPSATDNTIAESEVVHSKLLQALAGVKRPRDDETDLATTSDTQEAKRLKLDDSSAAERSLIIIRDPLSLEEVTPEAENNKTPTNTESNDDPNKTQVVTEPVMSERDSIIRANVASRMAFYATRDELRDQRSIDEGRDQRARLAMKPCEIICKLKTDNLPMDEMELTAILNALKK